MTSICLPRHPAVAYLSLVSEAESVFAGRAWWPHSHLPRDGGFDVRLLYADVTGYVGPWLWVSLALLAIEVVVFVGFSLR